MRLTLLVTLLAALAGDLETALREKDWPRARAILTREIDARPDRPGAAYNLACVEALSGRREEAMAALRLAAERGFSFTATLLRDVDLDSIRDHPGYAVVLDRVKENNARALEAFRPRAEKATVLLFPPKDRSRKAPLLVALHHSGGTAAGFAPLFTGLAQELGFALAVPQGINPDGAGFDWGVVEQGGLLVERAIERAAAAYDVDRSRVFLAGYSNGASTALILALRKPAAYAGVLSIAGFYEERVSKVLPGKAQPRFALLAGARAEEADSNRKAASALEAAGGAVLLRIFGGLGHALPPQPEKEIREALRFLFDAELPTPPSS